MNKFICLCCLLFAIALAHETQAKPQKPIHKAILPSFAANPAVTDFIAEIAAKHGFSQDELRAQFAQIHPNPSVLQAIRPPSTPTQRSWQRYQARFINAQRIEKGLLFWQEHAATLAKARAEYGVPEEIIVSIIGVETFYGRNTGKYGVMEALSTLAFNYPPRADFFRSELEQFLLLAHENKLHPLLVKGSFAGAIGIPQFMPGSQRRYAVDFDGDNRVDLCGSVNDAIGSVARFLEQHGWRAGELIALPTRSNAIPQRALLDAGIRPTLPVETLAEQGFGVDQPTPPLAALIDLATPDETTEYWLGFENFYVITRYNRSSFYAMSVHQLAEAIKAQRIRQTPLPGWIR